MAADIHKAEWHLLDASFPEADVGLPVPNRNPSTGTAVLQIQNLARSEPTAYRPGGMPRAALNQNVFNISPGACMPSIPVSCSFSGFDPATNPIQWRLVCRHVLCRYCNVGNYRYRSASDAFQREWRGISRAANFTIFDNESPECSCTYGNDSYLMGGQAILQVAAVAGGTMVSDFVHLQIGGLNPAQNDVLDYLQRELVDVDPNVVSMVRAIFAHESNYRQFSSTAQSNASMTFSFQRGYHDTAAQPDCKVAFAWPADPPNFPSVAFDYGVGISQYTRVGGQSISSDIAWDWRENIRAGVNLFLQNKLKPRLKPGMSWRDWAAAAWAAYNGSGEAAKNYAAKLAASADGVKVSGQPVPGGFQIAMLKAPEILAAPTPWMPESLTATAV